MTTTQPLDLDAIQSRVNAATPGPWSADGHEIYQGTPDDYTINSLWIGETCNIDLPDHGDANGAFLAHARQDVPALLAEVERLRAERDRLLAFIERGFDTHMQFGVINPDGTTEMQPCADWCHACKLQRAEAERDCLAMAVQFALSWDSKGTIHELHAGIREIVTTMPSAVSAPTT